MKILFAAAFACASLLIPARATAQPSPAQRSQMSDKVFKNVTVLKGIPVNQFMATMGFFSASLGENCTFCHVQESGGSWARYADDNDKKRTARSVSNRHIEDLHEAAMDHGAIAGKVSGAGGGGFFMFIVPPQHRVKLIRNLNQMQATASGVHFTGEGAESWVTDGFE